MSKIKTPVIYDTEGWYIKDADGNVVCDIDAEGLLSDEFHFIGNEIATAINEHADLKARLADANRGAQVNALVNESLAKKLKLAVEALEIRHQWKARNMGYQYSRFVCTVCGMKSDIDETETLCGVGAQRFLIKQTGEQR